MFNARLANHLFTIDNRYDYVESLFDGYKVASNSLAADNALAASDKDLEYEARGENGWQKAYLESLAIYRKICEKLILDDVVLFHCSALMIDGGAVLFTAPSGTGKSTHARLWREHFGSKVTMVNDDKPLLHIGNSCVTVYGTPYGGKDNIQNNISAPVKAIFLLEQSAENFVERMSSKEALPHLLKQTYKVHEHTTLNVAQVCSRTLDLVLELSKLPVFRLGCNMTEQAVLTSYGAAKDFL